jgi:hypothetical protein
MGDTVKAMSYQEIEEDCRRLYGQLNEEEELRKDEGLVDKTTE